MQSFSSRILMFKKVHSTQLKVCLLNSLNRFSLIGQINSSVIFIGRGQFNSKCYAHYHSKLWHILFDQSELTEKWLVDYNKECWICSIVGLCLLPFINILVWAARVVQIKSKWANRMFKFSLQLSFLFSVCNIMFDRSL